MTIFLATQSDNGEFVIYKAQPQFWKYAENAEEIQYKWFKELLADKNYISLVSKENNSITGFIIGRLIKSPEVYNPRGLTLLIDDYCIEPNSTWQQVGYCLLKEIGKIAKEKGAVQYCIVSGTHDISKCDFLENFGLKNASKWYVGSI